MYICFKLCSLWFDKHKTFVNYSLKFSYLKKTLNLSSVYEYTKIDFSTHLCLKFLSDYLLTKYAELKHTSFVILKTVSN